MTKAAGDGAATTNTGAATTDTKVDDKGTAATTATTDQATTDKAAADKAAADKATADAAAKDAADKAAAADKGKAAGSEGKDDKADAASKAPEKYELKTPDGAANYVTPDVTKRIEALARANGLDNAAAQGLLEEHVQLMASQASAFLAETKADKTYGGDNLVETQKLARAAVDRIRPEGHPMRESFQRFINSNGVGNQLDVVAFLADIGKMMAEDSPSSARATTHGAESQADKLYDNPASKALHAQS